MSEPEFEDYRARARVALAQASVIAEASALNLKDKTSHGKTEASPPPYSGASTLEDVARAIKRASGPRQFAEAVEHAEDLIREVRYSRIPNIDPQTREGKMLIGLDPRPAKVVARVYGFDVRSIYRWRVEVVKLGRRFPSG